MAESSVICATDDQWGRELHLKKNMAAQQLIVKNIITTLKHTPQQFNTSNEQLLLQDIKNPVATVVAKSYEEAAKELALKHGNEDHLSSEDFRFMASPEKSFEETAAHIRKRKQQDSASKLKDSFQRYLHRAATEVGKELRTTGSPIAAAYLQDEKRRCLAKATAGVWRKFDEEYMHEEEVVIVELDGEPAALNSPAPDPNQDAVSAARAVIRGQWHNNKSPTSTTPAWSSLLKWHMKGSQAGGHSADHSEPILYSNRGINRSANMHVNMSPVKFSLDSIQGNIDIQDALYSCFE